MSPTWMLRRYRIRGVVAAALALALCLALSASALAANAPTVTVVLSPCGLATGGTSVTITGTGFVAGSTVSFGSAPATGVVINSTTSISATSPAGTPGSTVDVTVTNGNGTSQTSTADQFTYDAANAGFGVCHVSTSFTDASGNPFTLAGGHPNLTITFGFNTSIDTSGHENEVADTKDISVDLPRGFVGNPTVLGAQCEEQQLEVGACPTGSQIGTVQLKIGGTGPFVNSLPVYDMVAPAGYAAEFGFQPFKTAIFLNDPVHILVSLQRLANGDDVLVSDIPNLPEVAPIVGTSLTLDAQPSGASAPFLTFPPDCGQSSLTTTVSADSWVTPGDYSSVAATSPGPSTGCDLSFAPTVTVTPTTTQADSAAGYTVDLNFPQNPDPTGPEYSPMEDATVALPTGVSLNPAIADGVGVCTAAEFNLDSNSPSACPQSSAVGTVTATTPLLPEPLTGTVYINQEGTTATTAANPFYIFVEVTGPGIDVKLRGMITATATSPTNSLLTASFMGVPPLPLSDLKLTFDTGARAVLANPLNCGPATTTAVLTPWSGVNGDGGPTGGGDASISNAFTVDANGQGGQCPAAWPAAVGFSAGPTSTVAGAGTNFTLTVTRADRTQPLTSLAVTTPPGFTGLLKNVPLCPAAAAATGTCGAASDVGTTAVGIGVGNDSISPPNTGPAPSGDQYYLTGTVYLTGPLGGAYSGDPFGLAIVVPAIAGPFNLSAPFGSSVVVLAGIKVNPQTAQLTIDSSLPTTQDGVPLHIQTINVTIARAGFGLNPTNCAPQLVTGTIDGAAVSSPYQVAGCANLAFSPALTASTSSATSGSSGASLDVKVAVPSGNANLRSVAVTFPTALSARLSTTQQACVLATFNANPANCPAASVIGTSTAVTPILPDTLTGTVYEVSNGSAGLPSIDVVLSADGVTVELTGAVAISAAGRTTSTFGSIPDVPISSFDLDLPEGPHSALASSKTDLCGQSLILPTTLVGQNGATIVQSTPISVTGCVAPKATIAGYAAALHGKVVFVRVDLTSTGRLKISGADIKTYSKSLRAGGYRIKIALNKSGLAARKRHRTVSIKLAYGSVSPTVKVKL